MIVLDTATWLWHVSDTDRLSRAGREAIAAAARLVVCAISVWEVGMLVANGRVALDRPVDQWVGQALASPGVELHGLEPAVALLATRLPGDPPGDPADRIIAATALERSAVLVTPDRRLRAYPHVPTAW